MTGFSSQQHYSNLESGNIDLPYSKIEQIAQLFEMRVEDMAGFDEKYVFYDYAEKSLQIAYNSFPVELKQLYEDQITTLKEEVSYLRKLFR